MKRYNKLTFADISVITAFVLSMIFFIVTFFIILPQELTFEELETYTILVEQIINDGAFSQDIDYSLIATEPSDINISIHPNVNDTYFVEIKTSKIIIYSDFSEGKIIGTPSISWPTYPFEILITIVASFIIFLILDIVIYKCIVLFTRKKSCTSYKK